MEWEDFVLEVLYCPHWFWKSLYFWGKVVFWKKYFFLESLRFLLQELGAQKRGWQFTGRCSEMRVWASDNHETKVCITFDFDIFILLFFEFSQKWKHLNLSLFFVCYLCDWFLVRVFLIAVVLYGSPSENQVDGLPLVSNNTGVIVSAGKGRSDFW